MMVHRHYIYQRSWKDEIMIVRYGRGPQTTTIMVIILFASLLKDPFHLELGV